MKLLGLRTTLPVVVAVASVMTLALPLGLNWLAVSRPPSVGIEWPTVAQKQTQPTIAGEEK